MFTLDSTYGPTVSSADLKLSDKTAKELASNAAVMYLLTNGLKQSIGDAAAGEKDEAKASDKRLKKLSAILDGTISVGTRGPQKKGLEAFRAEAAMVILKAETKRAGQSWPTGKGSAAKIAEKIQAFWTKAEPNAKLLRLRHEAESVARQNFALQSGVTDGEDEDIGV